MSRQADHPGPKSSPGTANTRDIPTTGYKDTAPRGTEPPWVKTYQHDRLLKAASDWRAPVRRRLVDAALGRMRRNGHAMFGKGELLRVLARPELDDKGREVIDRSTGEVISLPIAPATLSRAIKAAIAMGELAQGSSARCLRVRQSVARGGGRGQPSDPCRWCDQPSARRRRYAEASTNLDSGGQSSSTNFDPDGQSSSSNLDPDGQSSRGNLAPALLILPASAPTGAPPPGGESHALTEHTRTLDKATAS